MELSGLNSSSSGPVIAKFISIRRDSWLRQFLSVSLILFILLKPRSHSAVDGLMTSIISTSFNTSPNDSCLLMRNDWNTSVGLSLEFLNGFSFTLSSMYCCWINSCWSSGKMSARFWRRVVRSDFPYLMRLVLSLGNSWYWKAAKHFRGSALKLENLQWKGFFPS